MKGPPPTPAFPRSSSTRCIAPFTLRCRAATRLLAAHLPRAAPRPETGDQAWLEKLEVCMAENLCSPGFDVTALAGKLGYSGRQLRRRIVAAYRLVPAALLLQRRLERAHELIEARHHATVAEVAHAVGLSPTYFSRRYRQAYRCQEIRL